MFKFQSLLSVWSTYRPVCAKTQGAGVCTQGPSIWRALCSFKSTDHDNLVLYKSLFPLGREALALLSRASGHHEPLTFLFFFLLPVAGWYTSCPAWNRLFFSWSLLSLSAWCFGLWVKTHRESILARARWGSPWLSRPLLLSLQWKDSFIGRRPVGCTTLWQVEGLLLTWVLFLLGRNSSTSCLFAEHTDTYSRGLWSLEKVSPSGNAWTWKGFPVHMEQHA